MTVGRRGTLEGMTFGLHHVQLAIEPGSEDRCRAFYVGVLGLTEIPKPPALAGLPGPPPLPHPRLPGQPAGVPQPGVTVVWWPNTRRSRRVTCSITEARAGVLVASRYSGAENSETSEISWNASSAGPSPSVSR
jgi:catechol 2,3-dioxygenase-like lactoylglutathione lyase family enzyme